MSKIDTFKIKEMTNQLIGYDNFKMEEDMRKKKYKKIALFTLGFVLFGGSVVTVNALTNNGVVNTIGKVIPIKIVSSDEESGNATCKEVSNGKYSCTYEGELIDGQLSYSVEYETDNVDDTTPNAKVYYGYVDLSDEDLESANFNDAKEIDEALNNKLKEFIFANEKK